MAHPGAVQAEGGGPVRTYIYDVQQIHHDGQRDIAQGFGRVQEGLDFHPADVLRQSVYECDESRVDRRMQATDEEGTMYSLLEQILERSQ